MEPNIQQIPQGQMMNQNNQMQMENLQQIPQNQQLYQIIQANPSPNHCEKFSKFITGSYNIPFIVFLILMGASGFFIFTLLVRFSYISGYLTFSSFGNLLFALFVWGPMAVKIEKNTTTVRYGCLYLINNTILSFCTLSLPLGLQSIWKFILFETLLIALSNINKKIKFFCFKISGKGVIACSIIYTAAFNWLFFFSLIITIAYTYAYQKWLINKFAISNEKVERIENWCLIAWLKNKISTFITLKDVLEKGQEKQPLMQNNNNPNPNNSSFVPINMYPIYYSGVAPGMQQMQPMEQIPQVEEIRSVDSNANYQ